MPTCRAISAFGVLALWIPSPAHLLQWLVLTAVSGATLDLAAMLKRKGKIVEKSTGGISFLFRKNKVEWIKGWGHIDGPGKVTVTGEDGGKTTLSAKDIVIESYPERGWNHRMTDMQATLESTLAESEAALQDQTLSRAELLRRQSSGMP